MNWVPWAGAPQRSLATGRRTKHVVGPADGCTRCTKCASTQSRRRRRGAFPVLAARVLDQLDALAGGAKLFALHCAECHGEMAEGGKKAPSLMADEIQQSTPGTLFWLLSNGVVRRGMPVWSKLPEPQRWQLVRFLKSPETAPVASVDNASKP